MALSFGVNSSALCEMVWGFGCLSMWDCVVVDYWKSSLQVLFRCVCIEQGVQSGRSKIYRCSFDASEWIGLPDVTVTKCIRRFTKIREGSRHRGNACPPRASFSNVERHNCNLLTRNPDFLFAYHSCCFSLLNDRTHLAMYSDMTSRWL